MKFGIISDTHGCYSTWKKIYDCHFNDCDLIIHAGDVLYHGPRNDIPQEYRPKQLAEALNNCHIPLLIAAGNCDAEVDSMVLDYPILPYVHIMMNGLRIIVNHGHTLSAEEKQNLAKKFKANIFITGHSHIPTLEVQDNIIYLNPGSPGMSKAADGRGTIAIIENNIIKIIAIENGEIITSERL